MPQRDPPRPRGGSRLSLVEKESPPPTPAVPLKGPDLLLLLALAGLLSVGMVMVFSALVADGELPALKKLAFQFGVGLPAFLIGLLVPLPWWRRLAPLLLIGSALALWSLLWDWNPLAITRGGSTRWLGMGTAQIQPSEFAKLALVLFAAQFLEKRGPKMGLFKGYGYWFTFLTVLGVIAALIYVEPDLGTALVLAGTLFCMLVAAEVDWKALVVGVLLAAFLVLAVATTKDHQRQRLQAYWNPWEYHHDGGHQVIQSWMAMARGGWFGVGMGQSLQKLDNRLPEAETDFIFAVIAEELGLIRALGVIALYMLLVWRGLTIAARAPDRYSLLVATGVVAWISVQAGMNLGVVTGTIPNTGVPLPFLSSGGSSTVALMMAVGILTAISRRQLPHTKEATP